MKKAICLLALVMILLPSLALSQRKLQANAGPGIRKAKWERLAKQLAALKVISKPLLDYYSTLFQIDLEDNPMGADLLALKMPRTTRYVREGMLQKYGFDIASLSLAKGNPGVPFELPPELQPWGRFLGMAGLIVSGYLFIDERFEQHAVADLVASGFNQDSALAAAEHITNEGTLATARFLDTMANASGSLCSVAGVDCFTEAAKLLIFLESIRDAKDFDPADYDPNEGFIPNGMKPPNFRSFPDDGGGYRGPIIGLPGPGENAGDLERILTECWIYGPIAVDPVTGLVIWGFYRIPC